MIHLRYGDNKPKYIRWAIYTLFIAVAVILQNSSGGLLEFFGARVLLCLPVCISIARFEREVPAAIFGVIGGALWDISGGADGFNAFFVMVLCAVVSLLISHLMRNNIITAFVLNGSALAIYQLLYIIIRIAYAGNPIRQMFTFYLPSLLISMVFVPACYFIIKSVFDSHKTVDE